MGNHVQRASEVGPVSSLLVDKGLREPISEIYRADAIRAAGITPECIDGKETEILWWKRKRPLLRDTVDQRNQWPVAIVQAAATVTLEVVVVGPPNMDMRIDRGKVRPVVVGVGGDVRGKQRCTDQHVEGAVQISPHVERRQHWRPQLVIREEGASLTQHRHLLRIADHSTPGANRRLLLKHGV